MSAVYELELLTCKFCPGVLKPDVFRVQKVRGFRFYRCEQCDRPNIFAERNLAAGPVGRRAADVKTSI
jgi:hypothetical protein